MNYETIGLRGDEQDREARRRFAGTLLLSYYLYRYHNDKGNYWNSFMETLPTEEDLETMPLTWNVEKVEELPPKVQELVKKQKEKLQKEMELVKTTLNVELDERLFKWAWMCVNTRCIYMNIPGTPSHKEKVTLAPFADFINHTCDRDSSVNLKIDGRGLTLTARQEYEAGQELYLSYGAHDNARLLIEYGFTVPENPWDTVDISDYILPKLNDVQLQCLEQEGYVGANYTVNREGPSFRTIIALATSFEQIYLTISGMAEVPRRLEMLIQGEGDTDMYPSFKDELTTLLRRAKLELCDERESSSLNEASKTLLNDYKQILQQAINDTN